MSAAPRCPVCNSARILQERRPSVTMQRAGSFTFGDRAYDRCHSCGHTWNHKAKRTNEPAPNPGFWGRLFRRIFPLTK